MSSPDHAPPERAADADDRKGPEPTPDHLDVAATVEADRLDVTTTGWWSRALVVMITVGAVLAVGLAHRERPIVAALLIAIVVAYGKLSLIDLAEQRLPNRITYPLAAATAVAVVVGGLVRGDPLAGFGAVAVGVAFAAGLFVAQFGMGDVKMGLTVGTVAGWFGLDVVYTTIVGAIVSGGVVAAVLLLVYRRRGVAFSYGPFLAIGSILGMIAAGS